MLFSHSFISSNAHGLLQVWSRFASFTSLLGIRSTSGELFYYWAYHQPTTDWRSVPFNAALDIIWIFYACTRSSAFWLQTLRSALWQKSVPVGAATCLAGKIYFEVGSFHSLLLSRKANRGSHFGMFLLDAKAAQPRFWTVFTPR